MILITGATGLVGSRLVATLKAQGKDQIRILTRNKNNTKNTYPYSVEVFNWDPTLGTVEEGALEGVDTVIHLAGEGVADGRWTDTRKARILNSRVKGTQALMSAIKASSTTPKKFICASAIGIYGDREQETLTEESTLGNGFLADVCKQWEDLAKNHGIPGMTSHSLRIGIVLSAAGGALGKMLLPFKMGVGGRLGNGKQFMSWIHIDDLVGQILFLAENPVNHSVYNAVAPNPVDNNSFTKTLGKVLGRPTIFPVPGFGLKTLFGEMSEILLGSQRVLPKRFTEEGYRFKYENLEDALRDAVRSDKHSTKAELKTA
ncbi:MAG: TIGR01777 family protein [Deltaproteobacteria bacterium]|nr:MAG: TIGR01777 family protein [Deltaproteobacteria bacterium]TNF26551.1 MAG: TIGR01777 family protein [Deltaproteobacteria bacterium]